MMNRYLIVIEPTATGCSAYSPDLPGCIVTGVTAEDAERMMKEAIEFHIEGLQLAGEIIPKPTSRVAYCEVPA